MRYKSIVSYIIKNLGEYYIRKDWINFRCPYHHGSKKNFGINVKFNRYKCFACDANGTLYNLYEYLSDDDVSYLTEDTYDSNPIDIPELYNESKGTKRRHSFKRLNNIDSTEDIIFNNHEWFMEHYYNIFDCEDSIIKNDAIYYMNKRNADMEWVDFGIMDIQYTAGRITFPFWYNNKVVFYQSRNIYNLPLKTLNSKEIEGWLPKSSILWNYDNINRSETICLTEGIFDAISCMNFVPSTCLLGSTISHKQINLLKKTNVKSIIVFLDKDAVKSMIDVCYKLKNNKFNVMFVDWGKYKTVGSDPNELPINLVKEMLINASEFNDYSNIELQSRFV